MNIPPTNPMNMTGEAGHRRVHSRQFGRPDRLPVPIPSRLFPHPLTQNHPDRVSQGMNSTIRTGGNRTFEQSAMSNDMDGRESGNKENNYTHFNESEMAGILSPTQSRDQYNQNIMEQYKVVWINKWVDYTNR